MVFNFRWVCWDVTYYGGFPGGVSDKESRNTGLIPGSRRSPGRGCGNPSHYSCLENPMDRGALWATAHRVIEELDMTQWLSMHGLIAKVIYIANVAIMCVSLCFKLSHCFLYSSVTGHKLTPPECSKRSSCFYKIRRQRCCQKMISIRKLWRAKVLFNEAKQNS